MNQQETAELADQFFSAIERGDFDAAKMAYSADVKVWHNYDDRCQTRDENMAVIASFPTLFKTWKYCDVQRSFFGGGFVQQHVLRGLTHAGAPYALFACMVVSVAHNKITRLDEYFDPAQVPT